jgi:hypothetical protein
VVIGLSVDVKYVNSKYEMMVVKGGLPLFQLHHGQQSILKYKKKNFSFDNENVFLLI